MTEKEIRALLEGAYAQTATLPGYWLKYDEFTTKFNELVNTRSDSSIDVEDAIDSYYPDRKFEENYQLQGSEEIIRAIRIAPNKLTFIKNLKRKIEHAIEEIRPVNNEGWKPFASVGNKVPKEEILAMGFIGIRHAVECNFGKRYEFRSGDVTLHEAPVLIRDTKTPTDLDIEKKELARAMKSVSIPAECVKRPKQGSYIGEAIDSFAFFPKSKDIPPMRGWDAAINDLAINKALPERWYYDERDQVNKPILKNYVSFTFERLRYEDEIEKEEAKRQGRAPHLKILENKGYAVFNTGLVDNIYDPIYAYFKRNDGSNPTVKQPWIFVAFNTANSYHQKIMSKFPYRPQRASYFHDTRELYYDTTAQAPTLDWDHFLKDNISRLPIGFLKKGFAENFAFVDDVDSLPRPHREAYYRRLAEAIYNDDDWKQFVTTRFRNALDVALARVAWNYKTAIPVYFPKEKSLQLLLPLALEDKKRIDVALVCNHVFDEEEHVNNYEGRTIFTLDMAYNNARLITRPDSDWLMADMCQIK